MTLHAKKDFAKMCGMKTGNLTNYIKRGKVEQQTDEHGMPNKDGLIDDATVINLEFLNDRLDFLEKKSKAGETPEAIKKEISDFKSKSIAPPQDPVIEAEAEKKLATLTRKKALADLEKKLIDTKKAQLEFQILQGEHVPVDLVRDVFTELGKTLLTSYKDSGDTFLTEVAHQHKMPAKVVAALKGELVTLINTSHAKAIETASRKVSAIVSANKKYNLKQDESESNIAS